MDGTGRLGLGPGFSFWGFCPCSGANSLFWFQGGYILSVVCLKVAWASLKDALLYSDIQTPISPPKRLFSPFVSYKNEEAIQQLYDKKLTKKKCLPRKKTEGKVVWDLVGRAQLGNRSVAQFRAVASTSPNDVSAPRVRCSTGEWSGRSRRWTKLQGDSELGRAAWIERV